jgi:hypothetical protein
VRFGIDLEALFPLDCSIDFRVRDFRFLHNAVRNDNHIADAEEV